MPYEICLISVFRKGVKCSRIVAVPDGVLYHYQGIFVSCFLVMNG